MSYSSTTLTQRISKLLSDYKNTTGVHKTPEFIVVAPGRVNLIGDHLDYHGYSVLPMTIEKSVYLVVDFDSNNHSQSSTGIPINNLNIINQNQVDYATFQCQHSFKYGHLLASSNNWQNYILCGYHGVLAEKLLNINPNDIVSHAKSLLESEASIKQADELLYNLPNIMMFVDSDLPPASGLSSSSALVCASAVAFDVLLSEVLLPKDNGDKQDKINYWNDSEEFAYKCSKYEWLIGTRGGAMDQAVIMTGAKGYAKYIEFEPLKCYNVELPKDAVWLVSHSGNEYQKSTTNCFNKLVLETKIGAALIVKRLNIDSIALNSTITLKKIQSKLNISENEFCKLVDETVFTKHKRTYSIQDICNELQINDRKLKELFNMLDEYFIDGVSFKLADRILHVLSEAARVKEFKSICNTSKDLVKLGQVMLASHKSLKDLYEVSTKALNTIVECASAAGAYGSRLTGAGFGGCVVTLVNEERKCQVLDALKKVSKFTFIAEPQRGCQVIRKPVDFLQSASN